MKTLLKIALLSLITFLNFGCAQNFYNIPRESYEKKVRVLGVAPIFSDGESDIRVPDREALLAMVRDLNRKNEPELVARLKDTGAYLSVRMPETPADQLFSSLFFRRERRSDAGIFYNKYFFQAAGTEGLHREKQPRCSHGRCRQRPHPSREGVFQQLPILPGA